MKRLILSLLLIGGLAAAHAQEAETGVPIPTQQGKWIIEANTGFGSVDEAFLSIGEVPLAHTAHTGFALSTSDQLTLVALGGEAGYFIVDDVALKFGFGFQNLSSDLLAEDIQSVSYKVGTKFYLLHQVPIQADITGAYIDGANSQPLWLGVQAGYAAFLTPNISLEPGLRFNQSLNENFTEDSVLELRIGFALLF